MTMTSSKGNPAFETFPASFDGCAACNNLRDYIQVNDFRTIYTAENFPDNFDRESPITLRKTPADNSLVSLISF